MAHTLRKIILMGLAFTGSLAAMMQESPLAALRKEALEESNNTGKIWRLLSGAAPSCSSQLEELKRICSWFGRNARAELLHRAIRENNCAFVELFANVTSVNHPVDGQISLHEAACSDNPEIIHHLLGNGACINAKDQLGYTPLYWAAILGKKRAASLFLEHGADLNSTRSNNGETPLDIAARAQAPFDTTPLLLQYGADPTLTSKRGRTALHGAVGLRGKIHTIRLLIECGADSNATDMAKRTPLHLVAIRSNDCSLQPDEKAAQTLVSYGADIHAKDNRGDSPLSLARGDLQKTLKQMDREQLAAIKSWSEWLHTRHAIPRNVIKYVILEMALTQAQRDRLAENASPEENHNLEGTGLLHGLVGLLSYYIL